MFKLLLLSTVLTATDAFAAKPQEPPAAKCTDAPDAVVAETAALLKGPSVASCAEVIAAGLCWNDEAVRLCCATCAASKGKESFENRKTTIDNRNVKREINRRPSAVDYCMSWCSPDTASACNHWGARPVMTRCDPSTYTDAAGYTPLGSWFPAAHLRYDQGYTEVMLKSMNVNPKASSFYWVWRLPVRYQPAFSTWTSWNEPLTPQVAVDEKNHHMLQMYTAYRPPDKWSAHWDKLVEAKVWFNSNDGADPSSVPSFNSNDGADGFLLKSRWTHHCIGVGTGSYWPNVVMKSCDHNDNSQIWVLRPLPGRPSEAQLVNMIDHQV